MSERAAGASEFIPSGRCAAATAGVDSRRGGASPVPHPGRPPARGGRRVGARGRARRRGVRVLLDGLPLAGAHHDAPHADGAHRRRDGSPDGWGRAAGKPAQHALRPRLVAARHVARAGRRDGLVGHRGVPVRFARDRPECRYPPVTASEFASIASQVLWSATPPRDFPDNGTWGFLGTRADADAGAYGRQAFTYDSGGAVRLTLDVQGPPGLGDDPARAVHAQLRQVPDRHGRQRGEPAELLLDGAPPADLVHPHLVEDHPWVRGRAIDRSPYLRQVGCGRGAGGEDRLAHVVEELHEEPLAIGRVDPVLDGPLPDLAQSPWRNSTRLPASAAAARARSSASASTLTPITRPPSPTTSARASATWASPHPTSTHAAPARAPASSRNARLARAMMRAWRARRSASRAPPAIVYLGAPVTVPRGSRPGSCPTHAPRSS